MHPDDLPQPVEFDSEEQKRFEQGCGRLVVIYLLCYVIIGLATTVFSVATGTHWWVLGWGWPFIITMAMVIGVSLGAWGDKQ